MKGSAAPFKIWLMMVSDGVCPRRLPHLHKRRCLATSESWPRLEDVHDMAPAYGRRSLEGATTPIQPALGCKDTSWFWICQIDTGPWTVTDLLLAVVRLYHQCLGRRTTNSGQNEVQMPSILWCPGLAVAHQARQLYRVLPCEPEAGHARGSALQIIGC